MDKDKRIRELESQVEMLLSDPRAEFYRALTEGVKYISKEIKNKTLSLDEDAFAKSVLVIAEKSEKMFVGLTKGLETFSPQEDGASSSGKGRKKIVSNELQQAI